ncbi:MAG: PKD domain-containing protein [Geobacteraceae bacterium]|nr:PKD domain-containing protein [Geobacteraceae bacterium]
MTTTIVASSGYKVATLQSLPDVATLSLVAYSPSVQNPVSVINALDVLRQSSFVLGNGMGTITAQIIDRVATYLSVAVVIAPVANFTGSPVTGIVPFSVTFTDTSANHPTSWSWNFGDGGTSTSQNPTHVYAVAGTYNVTLTATNSAGSNSITQTSYITAAPGGPTYQIPRSLRFRSSANASLGRTYTSNSRVWSFSCWVKRGKLGVISPILGDCIYFNSSDQLVVGNWPGSIITTTAVFRDPSAWYHIYVIYGACWVNGIPQPGQPLFTTLTNVSIGTDGSNYFDGYLAEVVFIDGTNGLPISTFGVTDPVWGAWTAVAVSPIQWDSLGNSICAMSFNAGVVDLATAYGSGIPAVIPGSTTHTSSSIVKFGGASLAISGVATDSPALYGPSSYNLGTSNFTVGMWVYPTAVGSGAIRRYFSLEGATNAIVIREEANVIKAFLRMGSGTVYNIPSAVAPVINTWQYLCLTRNGDVFTLYRDGSPIASLTQAGSIDMTGIVAYLGCSGATEIMTGYIDEFTFQRNVVNSVVPTGSVTYSPTYTYYGPNGCYLPFSNTANVSTVGYDYSIGNQNVVSAQFPDSAPADPSFASVALLLHGNGGYADASPAGNSITPSGGVSISSSTVKFGSGSFQFNGTSGYLTPSGSSFNFGTGDFTIEAWINLTAASGYQMIFGGGLGEFSVYTNAGCIEVGSWAITGIVASLQGTISAGVWTHVAVTRASGVVRIYINGWTSETTPVTYATSLSYGSNPRVGASSYSGNFAYFGGYMDDVRVTKGVARYIPQNNWGNNNISLTSGSTYDSMYDVPLGSGGSVGNGLGNYAVANPIVQVPNITNGNLRGTGPGSLAYYANASTQDFKTNIYFEVTVANMSSDFQVGISGGTNLFLYDQAGTKYSTAGGYVAFSASYTTGDIISVAYNTNGMVWFGKNGVWGASGNPVTLANPAFSTVAGIVYSYIGIQNASIADHNYGQQPFTYTPPTGYLALHTGNLPTPVIQTPSSYFSQIVRLGTGAPQTVSSLSYQPDLVWIKDINTGADNKLTDSVRGVTKALITNSTAAQTTDAGGVTAISSNGYTLGSDSNYNTSAQYYIDWAWRKSALSGFDIVQYTGNGTSLAVGHSLGVTPAMIIVFRKNGVASRAVWHQNLAGATYRVWLDDAAGQANDAGVFASAPSATQFFVGSTGNVNANGEQYVAYVFASVSGFSAFGSYSGNSSADGPFIYTGFRPYWILFKRIDTTGNWYIYDTARQNYNVMNLELYTDVAASETDGGATIDLLSNGFKLRTSSQAPKNATGGTYMYATFAENPFKYALAR